MKLTIFLKIFNVIFKQAKLSITMIFSTTKYFSIILHSISHKTVEAANYFGHYLSLETALKTAYFLTKNMSTDDFFRLFHTKSSQCSSFSWKTVKNRQYLKTSLGSCNGQKHLLFSLSHVKNFEEKSKNILLSKKSW